MPVRTTKTPLSACPRCHACLDGATSAVGAAPRPGDMSICAYCFAVLVFGDVLGLRLMSHEEMAALPVEEGQELRRMREILQNCRLRRGEN